MITDRSEPWRCDGSQKEIGAAQDQIGERQSPSEAHSVGYRAAEGCQEPDETSKEPSQATGLLNRESQRFVQVTGERRERRVIRQPLE